MTHSSDYNHLLDLPNVVGVWYDEEEDTVKTLVTEKLPEQDLPGDAIVANSTSKNTDVVESGVIRALPLEAGRVSDEDDFESPSDAEGQAVHTGKSRPPQSGMSEGPGRRFIGGTSGPFPAVVTNPNNGHWDDDVEEGEPVLVSNCHVFADAREVPDIYADPIVQPARIDGGAPDDIVGRLRGYVPLTEDTPSRVDCAARSTLVEQGRDYYNVPEEYGDEIKRENYQDLVGTTLTKTGRTTGVSSGEVMSTDASIKVHISGEGDTARYVLFEDQILTTAMSEPGDSGSAVFAEDGDLTGLLFAGSSRITAHNKIRNVERDLGVEMKPKSWGTDPDPEPDAPEDDSGNSDGSDDSSGGSDDGSDSDDDNGGHEHMPEQSFEDYVETQLVDEFGEENVDRQYYLSYSGRYVDLVAFEPEKERVWAYELENDKGSALNGSGQARFYATSLVDEDPSLGSAIPVLCVPDGHIDPEERRIIELSGVTVREIDLPDTVSISGV